MSENASVTANLGPQHLGAARDTVAQVLEEAKRQGASAAEAQLSLAQGLSVDVRLGEVETVEFHRDRGLAVTVFFGQRKGQASTSDDSPQSLRDAVAAAGLAGRVRAVHGRLPDVLAHPGGLTPGAYDRVITSSLLHHLPDPDVLWQSCKRLLRPGGVAVVLDLARPATDADARALVRAVAADAHPILQADFLHSLRAAFTPAEVTAQLDRAGLAGWSVSMASSRHLAVVGRRP